MSFFYNFAKKVIFFTYWCLHGLSRTLIVVYFASFFYDDTAILSRSGIYFNYKLSNASLSSGNDHFVIRIMTTIAITITITTMITIMIVIMMCVRSKMAVSRKNIPSSWAKK